MFFLARGCVVIENHASASKVRVTNWGQKQEQFAVSGLLLKHALIGFKII